MKLTKKLEAEILKLYHSCWDANLRGDIKTFASFLDNDVTLFGTAAGEAFTSKKEAFKFYKATADQMTGKADFRKRKISIKATGDSVVLKEECDLYVLAEEKWIFYDHARITAVFEQKEKSWKIVQWHASFPDRRTEEGEQINTDKIKAENVRLRDAVRRRTEELENKNRELEIETALEKVRAIAMSMKEPADMLSICKTISQQLAKLGVKEIRNVQTAIFYENRSTYMNYEYYAKHDKTIVTETSYTNSKMHKAFAAKMLKGKGEFFVSHIKGKKVKDWIAYQKTTNVFIDKFLNTASSLNYYWHSLGPVALGISTYLPLSEQDLALFSRFLKVFELAYRRYLDIEKAQAQAREAQIQLALERVRARTMAMQKSDELGEAASLLFQQVRSLGIESYSSGFTVWENNDSELVSWMCNADGSINPPFRMPAKEIEWHRQQYESWKKKEDFIIHDFSGKEMKDYYKYLRSFPLLDEAFKKSEAAGVTTPVRKVHNAFNFSTGNLLFITPHPVPGSYDIFKRFAKVFEQTYTRFLDLQKAEAQAREAEIELALERVRAKTMAMQKQDDLLDVTDLFAEQLIHLEFDLEIVNFSKALSYGDWDLWATSPSSETERATNHVHIPWIDHPFFQKTRLGLDNLKKGIDLNVAVFNKEEKDSFLDHIFSNSVLKNFSEESKAYLYSRPGFTFSAIFLKETWVSICKYDTRPFTDEQHVILRRFVNAFGQAYTRFLDLQKAEAQARESQIQLALERVRARTMAMQHSEELQEAANLLFQQLQSLGIPVWTCGYNIWEKEEQFCTGWMSTNGAIQPSFRIPLSGNPTFVHMKESRLKGELFYIEEISGDALAEHYRNMFSLPDFKAIADEQLKDGFTLPTFQINHVFNFKHGNLIFISSQQIPESWDIFKRFTDVFEQTYTRFLDLQKAEAQARESQIQLALERVRARTMAMQKSDELPETSYILFQQMKELGEPAEQLTIGVVHEENNAIEISATLHGDMLKKIYLHSIDEPFMMSKVYNAWKNQQKTLVVELKGDELNAYNKYRNELTKSEMFPTNLGDEHRRIVYAAFFSKGMLALAANDPRPPQSLELLERFASVFDLTYTRFLDLKNAEAQAKEAQIEAALERVRSRSMGMQKSEELKDVIQIVYEQFVHLNINTEHTGFVIDYKVRDDRLIWVASKYGVPSRLTIPYFDSVYYNSFNEAKEKGLDFFATNLSFEEKNNFYRQLFTYIPELPEEDKNFYFNCPGLAISTVLLDDIGLYIENFEGIPYSDEDNAILMRFGKVFQQTYTRFLDLQKAEEQTRESQIQLALERVRARTMAMQQSNELPDAANILFQQMQTLGMPAWSAGYCTWNEDKSAVTLWMSSEGVIQPPFTAPTTEDELFIQMRKGQEEGKTFHVVEMGGDKLVAHYQYMRTLPVVGEILDSIINAGHPLPTFQIMHHAYFSKGFLLFITYEPVPEAHDIFKRFGKVFDQTYTRFLDLQKAEAQAREAKIEAALEKVRSRSLAMHHSDELRDVIGVTHKMLKEINVKHDTIAFQVFDFDKQSSVFWPGTNMQELAPKVVLPYDEAIMKEDTCHRDLWEAMRTGKAIINKVYSKSQKDRWFEYVFAHNNHQVIKEHAKQFILQAETHTVCFFPEKHSGLFADSWDGSQYAEEDLNVLKRAARVFEQAYVRFLDLQKAEAQAREAQIEAALERIRSRSLAMHHSSELSTVVDTLLQEFTKLEFSLTFCIINLINGDDLSNTVWAANPETGRDAESYYMKFEDYDFHRAMWNAWKAQDKRFVYTLQGEEKKIYDEYLYSQTEFRRFPKHVQEANKALDRYVAGFTFFKYSGLQTVSVNEITDSELEILERFGRVFEQAYTRFLDLQKAEAQAREAQIEAALERVRSKAMAMHNSNDLPSTAIIAFTELKKLGLHLIRGGVGLLTKETRKVVLYSATTSESGNDNLSLVGWAMLQNHPVLTEIYDSWRRGEDYFPVLQGELLKTYYAEILSSFAVPASNYEQSLPGNSINNTPDDYVQYGSFIAFSGGFFYLWTVNPANEIEINILKRFASVIDLTFKRYFDLQRAEAQAREAQIEASLERVRSRSMAMHQSNDLHEVIKVVAEQFIALGLRFDTTNFANTLPDGSLDVWISTSVQAYPSQIRIPYFENRVYTEEAEMISSGKDFLARQYTVEEKNSFFRNFFENTVARNIPEERKQYVYNAKGYVRSIFRLKNIFFAIASYDGIPYSDEENAVFWRFAKVFEQAYTRFNDLQKAEAQAREAQIEASLERVRSKTMAMHNSNDVGETVITMFAEFEQLGIHTNRCGVLIFIDENSAEVWTARSNPEGKASLIIGKLNLNIHNLLRSAFNAWKDKKTYHQYDLLGDDIVRYYEAINRSEFYRTRFDMSALPAKEFHSDFFFAEGAVFAFTPEPVAEEHTKIIKRFAGVFGQTYRRYLDLQKAETNAREARIEAAMEKVRARAMAMQKPNELVEVAELLRKEMGLLGVEELETSSIYIHNEASGTTECWYAIKDIRDNEKKLAADYMTINLNDTWVGREMLNFYKSDQKQVSILMQGENRKEWINYCAEHSKILQGYYGDVIPERTYHLLKFSNGYMGAASPGEISKESWDLLKRATTVFSLAYTRFSDLQIAEASAKEAIKQAALDRIRADIASMRTISDLDRITPLIWNELNILGIPFIRCGVFIMDESQQLIHTFLSTPEGKAIAAFHLPYDTPGNLSKVLKHWKDHNSYIDHWDQSAFTEMADVLVKQGAIASPGQYLDSIPHGGFYLHFLPFLQGMLYVGNTTQLGEEDIELIQHIADAFSTAYARYEDFNKLETAKQQVEKTLVDLRQAQTQLVQSEKMASLGELTAGIAHEIQNPLNFVNNFSDVSNELLDEMQEELAKGNIDDAMAIVEDVKQNLEKINHHGKRADGIVKGMLQHSRISAGQKEMTDINALADEYLRLAYHGLRAKDKSFNAKFETDFDPSIEKMNIVPQDIGRVILNLINNAFYAVSEKKKQNIIDYEPTVIVSTTKQNGNVEIRVKDNGIGIQQKVLDKIFQPFFTTKPTGQGTGLGLSLAYDIVTKGHDGELKVESEEEKGSEFIVRLQG